KAAVPELIKALGDKNDDVRKNAAEALGRIGQAAKDAVPALVKALGDKNDVVRKNAAETLGRIGPDAKDAVPELIQAVDDIGNAAAEAIGKIGLPAVPALIQALKDKNYFIRDEAAEILGRIGPAAKAAVPAIIQYMLNRCPVEDEKMKAWESVTRIHVNFDLEQFLANSKGLTDEVKEYYNSYTRFLMRKMGAGYPGSKQMEILRHILFSGLAGNEERSYILSCLAKEGGFSYYMYLSLYKHPTMSIAVLILAVVLLPISVMIANARYWRNARDIRMLKAGRPKKPSAVWQAVKDTIRLAMPVGRHWKQMMYIYALNMVPIAYVGSILFGVNMPLAVLGSALPMLIVDYFIIRSGLLFANSADLSLASGALGRISQGNGGIFDVFNLVRGYAVDHETIRQEMEKGLTAPASYDNLKKAMGDFKDALNDSDESKAYRKIADEILRIASEMPQAAPAPVSPPTAPRAPPRAGFAHIGALFATAGVTGIGVLAIGLWQALAPYIIAGLPYMAAIGGTVLLSYLGHRLYGAFFKATPPVTVLSIPVPSEEEMMREALEKSPIGDLIRKFEWIMGLIDFARSVKNKFIMIDITALRNISIESIGISVTGEKMTPEKLEEARKAMLQMAISEMRIKVEPLVNGLQLVRGLLEGGFIDMEDLKEAIELNDGNIYLACEGLSQLSDAIKKYGAKNIFALVRKRIDSRKKWNIIFSYAPEFRFAVEHKDQLSKYGPRPFMLMAMFLDEAKRSYLELTPEKFEQAFDFLAAPENQAVEGEELLKAAMALVRPEKAMGAAIIYDLSGIPSFSTFDIAFQYKALMDGWGLDAVNALGKDIEKAYRNLNVLGLLNIDEVQRRVVREFLESRKGRGINPNRIYIYMKRLAEQAGVIDNIKNPERRNSAIASVINQADKDYAAFARKAFYGEKVDDYSMYLVWLGMYLEEDEDALSQINAIAKELGVETENKTIEQIMKDVDEKMVTEGLKDSYTAAFDFEAAKAELALPGAFEQTLKGMIASILSRAARVDRDEMTRRIKEISDRVDNMDKAFLGAQGVPRGLLMQLEDPAKADAARANIKNFIYKKLELTPAESAGLILEVFKRIDLGLLKKYLDGTASVDESNLVISRLSEADRYLEDELANIGLAALAGNVKGSGEWKVLTQLKDEVKRKADEKSKLTKKIEIVFRGKNLLALYQGRYSGTCFGDYPYDMARKDLFIANILSDRELTGSLLFNIQGNKLILLGFDPSESLTGALDTAKTKELIDRIFREIYIFAERNGLELLITTQAGGLSNRTGFQKYILSAYATSRKVSLEPREYQPSYNYNVTSAVRAKAMEMGEMAGAPRAPPVAAPTLTLRTTRDMFPNAPEWFIRIAAAFIELPDIMAQTFGEFIRSHGAQSPQEIRQRSIGLGIIWFGTIMAPISIALSTLLSNTFVPNLLPMILASPFIANIALHAAWNLFIAPFATPLAKRAPAAPVELPRNREEAIAFVIRTFQENNNSFASLSEARKEELAKAVGLDRWPALLAEAYKELNKQWLKNPADKALLATYLAMTAEVGKVGAVAPPMGGVVDAAGIPAFVAERTAAELVDYMRKTGFDQTDLIRKALANEPAKLAEFERLFAQAELPAAPAAVAPVALAIPAAPVAPARATPIAGVPAGAAVAQLLAMTTQDIEAMAASDMEGAQRLIDHAVREFEAARRVTDKVTGEAVGEGALSTVYATRDPARVTKVLKTK
ncbi:MAG: HEAT repeat domain-containing protein, partial [Candidatus Omnitrophica bacterium]|nr:HEAT repeat domain-containing protein [Candidatus Omnitrophota bacterium]